MSISLVIIIITVFVSLAAFNNRSVFYKMQFNAYQIYHRKEYHRFFTYGFIHGDWVHLLINMFVLYSFSRIVENTYRELFGLKGLLLYILLYVGGLVFSTIFDYGKHRNNAYYNAVGASGAVSAVVFASILIHPLGEIYLFLIPFGIPSFIFGILYLVYSAYMSRRATGNVGHSAHFWGAVFGFVFTVILEPRLFPRFIESALSFI
ncbi:MAG: rhomboid family intramembrane serine protease [Bacteroidales bacterium]|nr:rhomboid family intramembrane serine protease [Bacteroidales bacterium]